MLLLTGLAPTHAQTVRAFEDALRRFDAGDLNGALAQVGQTLEENPGHLPARLLLGRIRLQMGHPVAAEEAFAEARQLGASSSLVALPLARARNQLGKFQLNVDSIEPADLSADGGGELWVELGNAWLALGRFVDARFAFDKAMHLPSGRIAGTLGMVSVDLEEGDLAQAETRCREVLDAAPDNADAWYIMGSLLERKSRLAQAESHFNKALELAPHHPKAQLARAIVVLNRNRPTEAVGLFETILQQRPWSLEAAYLLSQALAASGRGQAAEAALQHAVEMVSKVTPKDLDGNPRLLLISSLVLYDDDQLLVAQQFLRRYLANRPKDIQARKQAAKITSLTGRPLDAIRELRGIALERPKDAQVQVMLGDVFASLKDYVSAENHYRNAIDLTVPDLRLIGRLGLAQYGQGRTDLAIDTMRRLIDLAPGRSAGASIFLGILYLHTGELALAREVADEIARQMPENLLAINLQAVVAVAEKSYAHGRRLFESVLQRAPDFDPARINLIKLDIVEARYERAGSALDKLLAAEPDHVPALRTYAELLIAKNEYRSAADYLKRILTLKPSSVGDGLLLSRIHELLGESGDALSLLNALDKAIPGSVALQRRLAELHLARGEMDEARALLVDAAQLAGSNAGVRVAVAELQLKVGAYDDALQGMQRVLSEFPDAVEARLVMARVQVLQRRLNLADDTVGLVLEGDPDNIDALTLLGDIRLQRGQTASAIEFYLRAAGVRDSARLAVSLYRARLKAGRDGVALQELTAWNAAHPDNEMVMGVLADHHLRAGRRDQAIALYRRVTEVNARNASAYNNLAVALFDVDGEQALQAALRAYDLAPEDPAVLDTIGWILVQLGDLESGLARLREALIRNDRVPEVRYHLAVALEEFGNRAGALRELRRALSADTPFVGRADAERRLRRLESTK